MWPLSVSQNAGNRSVPNTSTVTLSVSSRSSVAAMSRIDLTPADTTVIGQAPRIARSADSSKVWPALRWTPPMPPVANTRIPACAASHEVAATVVPPVAPWATATGRSRTLSFSGFSVPASRCSWSGSSPTCGIPSRIAIVAGTAPESDTVRSKLAAASTFSGLGSPCVMIVDSSATTGSPSRRARATVSETTEIMSPWTLPAANAGPLSICTIGDLILDVVVVPSEPLVPDADTPATISFTAGGQAANVAAWAAALGARARLICARGSGDFALDSAAAELTRHGVDIRGPILSGRGGVVVSIADADGRRTMLSDRGAARQLTTADLDPAWVSECDVLHVSGYALLHEPMARSHDRGGEARAPRDGRPRLRRTTSS